MTKNEMATYLREVADRIQSGKLPEATITFTQIVEPDYAHRLLKSYAPTGWRRVSIEFAEQVKP